jgi:HD-like signal output (HDOD) protein
MSSTAPTTPESSGDPPSSIDSTEVAGWLFDAFHSPAYRPPVLPRVALQLLEVTRDPEVRVRTVARLLEDDAMLTAVTMRVANSAVHRASSEICTLEEAITRMGLRRVTELFLETAVNLRVFRSPGYEPAMELLRTHSAAVAHVARLIAGFSGLDGGHAFLCGLLHDVGLAAGFIAIGEHFGEHSKPSVDAVWSAVLEHHQAAGALLQQSWGLPDELGIVLGEHHVMSTGDRLAPIAAAVSLADSVVSELNAGMLNEVREGSLDVAREALGLDEQTMIRIRGKADYIVRGLQR